MRRSLTALTLLMLLLSTPAARADEPMCPLYVEASPTQLLRRLSLDLRQKVPSWEEYEAVGEGPVDEALVADFIASDDFRAFARRFHEDLLWTNVANVSLSSNESILRRYDLPGGSTVLSVGGPARRNAYRGDGNAVCADYAQTEWCTDDQTPGCDGAGMPKKNVDGLDGWVLVAPYWDPPTCTADAECESRKCTGGTCAPMKVCAFDAQETETWMPPGVEAPKLGDYDAASCNIFVASAKQGCGCGPNLRFCWTLGVEQMVRGELREQLLRLVDDVTVGGLGYSELLTTQTSSFNGPIAWWRRYLAPMTAFNQTVNLWFPGDEPLTGAIDYHDRSWQPAERTGVHSGILTLPAFALRFQTNRGRANRFRTAFMGAWFEPPATAEQPGCIPESDDVTQRCYCMHCHTVLEPLAAHWGNIAEAGTALISDRALFPEAKDCGPNATALDKLLCGRFYVNEPGAYGFGRLTALQFADGETAVHQRIRDGFDAGPAGLAKSIIDDGTFARTSVVHLFETLVRREPIVDATSPDDETALVDELAAELAAHDSFEAIVERIVMLEQYRRIR